jgi:hypothetical protein
MPGGVDDAVVVIVAGEWIRLEFDGADVDSATDDAGNRCYPLVPGGFAFNARDFWL